MKISIEKFSFFFDQDQDKYNPVLQLEVAPRKRGEEYILSWEYSGSYRPSFKGQGNVRDLVQSISEKEWMSGIPKGKIFEKVEKGVESLLVDEFKKLVPSYKRGWYEGAFLEDFKIPDDSMSVVDHIKPESVSDFARLSVLWVNYLAMKGELYRSKSWEERWVFFENQGNYNYPYWIRHFDENDCFHEYLPMEAVFVYPKEDYPIQQRIADAASVLDASIQKKDKFYKLDRYYAANCAKLLISLIHYSTVENEVKDWSLLKFPKVDFSNLGNETDFFKRNVEMTVDQGIIVPDKTGKFLDISQSNKKDLLNLLKDDPIYFRSIIDQWSQLKFGESNRGVLFYNVNTYETFLDVSSTYITDFTHKNILSELEEIWCPMINRIRPEVLQRMNGRVMTVKEADFWIGRYGNRRPGTFKGILTVNKETFDCTLTNFSYLIGAEVTISDILSYLTEEEKENLESYLFEGESPFSLYVDFSSKEKRGEDNFDDWSARTVIHFDHNETGSNYSPEGGYYWTNLGKPFMGKTTLKFNLAWMSLREEIWCALANSKLYYFDTKKSCYRNKVMTEAVDKIKIAIDRLEKSIISK